MASPTATAAEIVSVLDAAHRKIPGLQVMIREHCHGHDWMIDPPNTAIHINGGLSNHDAASAIGEAVAELELRIANSYAAPPLQLTPWQQLIPWQRDELAARRRTYYGRHTTDTTTAG